MRARVPMDVDLEDRLVFGLSPQRLGYVALAALLALACWRSLPVIGAAFAVVCLGAGASFGWGRWRGSGLDHWVVASTLWTFRTHAVVVAAGWRLPRLAVSVRRFRTRAGAPRVMPQTVVGRVGTRRDGHRLYVIRADGER